MEREQWIGNLNGAALEHADVAEKLCTIFERAVKRAGGGDLPEAVRIKARVAVCEGMDAPVDNVAANVAEEERILRMIGERAKRKADAAALQEQRETAQA